MEFALEFNAFHKIIIEISRTNGRKDRLMFEKSVDFKIKLQNKTNESFGEIRNAFYEK